MAVNLGKWLPTISHHNNLEKGKGDKNYYDSGKNDTTIIKMIVMIMVTAMVMTVMMLTRRLWVWGGLKYANTAAVFPPGTVWL